MAKNNPFLAFMGVEKKTAKIEALGGAEITYRDLTLAETDGFTKKMIKGIGQDGKPEIDFNVASEIKYEKVSKALLEPKMTVEELKSMHGSKAADAINEIIELIEPMPDEEEEGNE